MAANHYNIVSAAALVDGRRRTGYSVSVLFSVDMGESFESITHSVVFENEIDALKFKDRIVAKVRAAGPYTGITNTLNLEHWLWQPSAASYCGTLQKAPKAVPTFRPFKARPWTEYDL